MGQRVMHFSDYSGADLPEGTPPAKMILVAADKRRGIFVLDITDKEFDELREKGTKTNQETIKDLGLVA